MVKCHGPGVGFADEILREKKKRNEKNCYSPKRSFEKEREMLKHDFGPIGDV